MENIISIKPTRSKRKNPTTIENSKEKSLKNKTISIIKRSKSQNILTSLSDKILIFEDSLTLKNLTKLINTNNNSLNNDNNNNNNISPSILKRHPNYLKKSLFLNISLTPNNRRNFKGESPIFNYYDNSPIIKQVKNHHYTYNQYLIDKKKSSFSSYIKMLKKNLLIIILIIIVLMIIIVIYLLKKILMMIIIIIIIFLILMKNLMKKMMKMKKINSLLFFKK